MINRPHPLTDGGTFGMISGENPLFPAAVEAKHENLVRTLKQMGLHHEETQGRCYGSPERSVIVYGPRLDQMKTLGKVFGQESVVHSSGGKHQLHYTNGPDEGKFRGTAVGMPNHELHPSVPDDNYTHVPGHGYFRINFDFDQDPSGGAPVTPKPSEPVTAKPSMAKSLSAENGTAVNRQFWAHPNSYSWHDGNTNHHNGNDLNKHGEAPKVPGATTTHPHMDGSKPEANDQAAGAGVSTYAKFATPYGTLTPGKPSNLFHYDYRNKLADVSDLVKRHGFKPYYAGGQYGKPDLASRNYNTNHLMIYDPTPQSGGDFGEKDYTDAWRQTHELAHALTYPQLNNVYGEGRRIGKLGTHRMMNEAMRAVHWEWLAAHKQRDLSSQIGIHIPDETFHKELNTVMHDAVHRAVTGKFTEPSQEGYHPASHKVPLQTAFDMLREEGSKLGLNGLHETLKRKSEPKIQYFKKALPKGAKLDVKNPGDQTENKANRAGFSGSPQHMVMEDAGGGPQERGVQVVKPKDFGPPKGDTSAAWADRFAHQSKVNDVRISNWDADEQAGWNAPNTNVAEEEDLPKTPAWTIGHNIENEEFGHKDPIGGLSQQEERGFWSHPNFPSNDSLNLIHRSPILKRSKRAK